MQIRILAGCQRLMMALAIASLIIAPAGAAEPVSKGKPASETSLNSGNARQQIDDKSTASEPILFARSNYSWPFSSGPVYGTVDAASWSSAGMLHTAVGSFDLTRGLPNFPNELRAANKLDKTASQYFVMQVKTEAFADGTFDELKRVIVEQGGSIVGESPVAAFVVRMTPGAHEAVKDSPSILALLPYQPAFKLSPEIGRVPLLNAAKAASSVYSLKLQLFPGERSDVVVGALAAVGVTVRAGDFSSSSDTILVDADRSKLAAIAAIDQVFRIEEVLPLFLMSEETSTTIQAGKWNNGATPYTDAGVDGGGLDKVSQADDQILAILDNGIQLDAGDLSHTSTDPGLDAITGLPIAGHRKVKFYGTTVGFAPGGGGDLLGCDGNTTSGVTHGHTVAAVALGNATNVPLSYGTPYRGTDANGNFWNLDGVAPKARLVAYDGQVTPLTGRCDDIGQIPDIAPFPIAPGDLTQLLADAYAKGARIVNFSWGSVQPGIYDINAGKIDAFLSANSEAMVFVAAGNTGRDKDGDRVPDPNTIGAPAVAKNIVCVGASRNADDLGDPNRPNSRQTTSSNGPATPGALGRIAPLLMAPGNDTGSLGFVSEFHCRSNDNNQYGPVECDVASGQAGTSYASAAAAGAALLVRDYFAQGFYPDGTNANTDNAGDQVPKISGALLKAILVTSAEWMHGDENSQIPVTNKNLPFGLNLTRKFRGNREQGFGRIILTNALPLQTYPGAVTGLIVGDGGPFVGAKNSTTLILNSPPDTQEYLLNVCDTSQRLNIAIAWIDPLNGLSPADLSRDLNLEVESPLGRVYLGNFFTDDINGNNAIEGTENCQFTGYPWPLNTDLTNLPNAVDTGPWSLPTNSVTPNCTNVATHVDFKNNVEAVFLSPDTRFNGIAEDPATPCDPITKVGCEAYDNQIEPGIWKVRVKKGATLSKPDAFSIAIAGGVCGGSAARVQRVLPDNQLEGTILSCNDNVVVSIDEVATGGDPIADPAAFRTSIAGRTDIQVVDANNVVTDTESVLAADWTVVSFNATGNLNVRYDSPKILLTDGTTPESGNHALDVRDGQTIRVTYTDVGPTVKRVGTASVNCRPALAAGGVVFGQFGKDAFTLVDGGCEKDARGYFTFGFPDRYMDEGELVSYLVTFQSAEIGADLVNVSISLKAKTADADSPANCKPGSTPTVACADPNRTNNPVSPYLTVLDSPKVYDLLPSGKTISPSFTIQMAGSIPGTQKVDMILGVTAKSAGKGVESLIAQREVLNADEFSVFYSTDFPGGGTEPVGGYDINNNESLEGVTNDPHNFTNDYWFETRAYSSMLTTNPIANTKAPWNFDTNNGGFVNGLQNTSRPSPLIIFAQWGEDKNYNGRLDGFCSAPDANGNLTIPCTQGIADSFSCRRCTSNHGRICSEDLDCQVPPPNEGTCTASGVFGFCDFTKDEDRNPVNGSLDTAWSTLGGCGWQTKAPAASTGGVWHTGLIRSPDTGTCLAGGTDPADCQVYYSAPDADSIGDNNWWDVLLSPVLHRVNLEIEGGHCSVATGTSCTLDTNCPAGQTCVGDPRYQIAITDWAWNMSVDIPDTNTSVRLEFDTDVDKSAGVELFNDTVVLLSFRGKQGAHSGGNGPITGGFNMFSRISNCQDTDGNGSLDHCGTAAGPLCNGNKKKPDFECGGGLKISSTRGLCANPPAQKRCTGNPNLLCTTDAECNLRCSGNPTRGCSNAAGTVCDRTGAPGAVNVGCASNTTCSLAAEGTCADLTAHGTNVTTDLGLASPGEKCVSDPLPCTADSECGGAPGSCQKTAGNNREGQDNCVFDNMRQGSGGREFVNALEPYGLATPPDDDAANGFCHRSDSLNLIDKSIPCTSAIHCDAAGGSYASIRSCSLRTSVVCTADADCGTCSNETTHACTTSSDCLINEGTCTAKAIGTCSNVVYNAVCEKPNEVVDEFVQRNGPGRNYSIQTSNGPDMRFTTLEDIYGDTGNAFQAALGFDNREADKNTTGVASGLGIAVDDMVISWKESRLDVDTHTCGKSCSLLYSKPCTTNADCNLGTEGTCVGSGECATLDSSTGLSYQGNSVVSLTVTDKSPYDAVDNKNDCNGDGDYTDIGKCSVQTNPEKGCTNTAECSSRCSLATTKLCTVNSQCSGHCSVTLTTPCTLDTNCPSPQTCVGFEGTCVPYQTCVPNPSWVDDQDCNNNGSLDVAVKLTSDAETTGEVAVLDQIAPGSALYKGNFPYSTLYDSPGTLFVVQSGTALPIVTALYRDRNDGTGSPCKNDQEPTKQGFITATTTISAIAGAVTVNKYGVVLTKVCSGALTRPCNANADCTGLGTCTVLGPGDDDGFADPNEVNDLVVQFANKTGVDIDDLTATLGTTSTSIECITRSFIAVGAMKAATATEASLSDTSTYLPFQFKVANVNRSVLADVLQAKFTVTVRSNKFDALTRATEITLDLDFDATGGGTAAPSLYEDFEAGLGKFTLEYLDKGLNNLRASNGYRCQYNDPLALNSNSATNKDCFLGFTSDPSTGVNDWHVHTSSASMGVGRAFSGKQSLHLGVHTNSDAKEDTTRCRHIMSVKTINPVNVGLGGGSPELNFAQQVSFVDNSSGVNVSLGEAADRGVVEAKSTLAGSHWVKLYPYVNVYDQQGTDDFSNCVFDPVDDGNNEDSFFDIKDPDRRLGPSSTCFPEFTFVHQGQTDYRKDFDVTDIGLASDGPGLKPCSSPVGGACLPANTAEEGAKNNPGTWVRPRFNLLALAAQSVNLRFLFSSIEIGGTETMFTFFGRPNVSADDGWYIDDIHIEGARLTALVLTPDPDTLASPLACGTCSAIGSPFPAVPPASNVPSLTATPTSLAAPGQIVTLSAKKTTVDLCPNGVLQFQFWNDVNGNGTTDGTDGNLATGVGDAGDIMFRDWTDNSTFVDAPLQSTRYGVKVRCSTSPSCDSSSSSVAVTVQVTCPSLTNAPFPQFITMTKVPGQPGAEPHPSATINWNSAVSVDAIRGSLVGTALLPAQFTLKARGAFDKTVNLCLATNSAPTTSLADAIDPGTGNGFYYLVRGQLQKYTTGAPSERGYTGFCNSVRPRDSDLVSDPVSCP